jgi:hypothetical protein
MWRAKHGSVNNCGNYLQVGFAAFKSYIVSDIS